MVSDLLIFFHGLFCAALIFVIYCSFFELWCIWYEGRKKKLEEQKEEEQKEEEQKEEEQKEEEQKEEEQKEEEQKEE